MDLMHIAGLVVGVAGASPPFLVFGFDAWERLKAVYVPQEDGRSACRRLYRRTRLPGLAFLSKTNSIGPGAGARPESTGC